MRAARRSTGPGSRHAGIRCGSAAFGPAGYAFTALFAANSLSLPQLVQTEILHGMLAPVGHGLWTAILGGCSSPPVPAATSG